MVIAVLVIVHELRMTILSEVFVVRNLPPCEPCPLRGARRPVRTGGSHIMTDAVHAWTADQTWGEGQESVSGNRTRKYRFFRECSGNDAILRGSSSWLTRNY